MDISVSIAEASDEICSYKFDNSQALIDLNLESEQADSIQIFGTDLAPVDSIENLPTFYLVVTKTTNLKLSLNASPGEDSSADETIPDPAPPS